MPLPRVIRTKIVPPPVPSRTLVRERVVAHLSQAFDHRLTEISAGPGYGKSTALGSLVSERRPVIWFQASEEDADPLIFVQYLVHAVAEAFPDVGGALVAQIEGLPTGDELAAVRGVLIDLLNALQGALDAPTVLVIDDVHLALKSPENHKLLDLIIQHAPAQLHLITAGRTHLDLPSLPRLAANGELLRVGQEVLAFTSDEVDALFATQYGHFLADDDAQRLIAFTEGWPLSFPLLWQRLRKGDIESIADVIASEGDSLEALFGVLATDVISQQPEAVQTFLQMASVLQVMNAEACDFVRGAADSEDLLAYLMRQDLFIFEVGDGNFRFHNVFLQFLRQTGSAAEQRARHARAATYFRQQHDRGQALYHLLQAQNYAEAAEILALYGRELLREGRLGTLASHLDAIPADRLARHPELLLYLGEIARLRSRFKEALGWLEKAEEIWRARSDNRGTSRALRSQARVHLDTVDAVKAEELLQESIRLSDGTPDRESQASLYELLAENKLNAGDPQKAMAYMAQARALWDQAPEDEQLNYRVMLRTGQLQRARKELEHKAEEERASGTAQASRAHRETQLLLSLIYVFMGEADLAAQAAEAGIGRASEMESQYVMIIGKVRQAFAWLLASDTQAHAEAHLALEEALALSQSFRIPRTQVTSLWGLARVHGYRGDIAQARAYADKAIEITIDAGDEWLTSLIQVMLAASLVLAGQFEQAARPLQAAIEGFQECSDPFGVTIAKYWQCLMLFRLEQDEALRTTLAEVLAAVREHDYGFLFTHNTFMGAPDLRLFVPLLIDARDNAIEAATATALLKAIGLQRVEVHPGYQLRVVTLGNFQVWRGDELITTGEWRRESAKQLFQLLLSFYDQGLDREQVYDYLFPSFETEKAARNFKIALSTLFNVLEPERNRRGDSAYVTREGSLYRVRREADLQFDANEFLRLVKVSEVDIYGPKHDVIARLENAVALYNGDYLPGARYDDWAAGQRELLSAQFLITADRLCKLLLDEQQPQKVIDLVFKILGVDRYSEPAYRHLMLAYDQLGDKRQIVETYQRFAEEYRQVYDIAPSEQATVLYESLLGK